MMFDRSLLRKALFDFVVLADTHYMLEPRGRTVEFESRLKQTRRAETALRLSASLQPAFVIHLGDLVQEYPDTQAFPTAMAEALEQLRRCEVTPYYVAGNHDVGDKPDPTMPTRPVTPESLESYHQTVGHSWYSFDRGACHFVVLNSQILNSPLPEAAAQQKWLEGDLAQHAGERIFLFLHLPPFLFSDNEPALGHYDNIAQPARSWLLELVRRHRLEMMVAGHVHCTFLDRIGPSRYLICNSTSFTRPGFPHMFTSAPPPDRGRDDVAKLGFYLFRVFADRTDVHFLRTGGAEELPADATRAQRLITRSAATLEAAPLGVSMRHPLSWQVDVPLAWPSAIRQRVRNDYPLLSCLELGATAIRIPATDLSDPFQAGRLAVLRDEGVNIVATAIWSDDLDVGKLQSEHRGTVDTWELQLPGTLWPSAAQLQFLRNDRASSSSIMLSTIIPVEKVAGKQHFRTRHGFRPEELPELQQRLKAAGCHIDRVLCRLDARRGLMSQLTESRRFEQIGVVDWSLELSSVDDSAHANAAAEAIFGMFAITHSHNQDTQQASSRPSQQDVVHNTHATGPRLFVGPLIDFDRTMDVAHGLLDTLCNPRPTFHVLRVLNSVLAAIKESLEPDEHFALGPEEGSNCVRVLQAAGTILCLVLAQNAEEKCAAPLRDKLLSRLPESPRVEVFNLQQATIAHVDTAQAIAMASEVIDGNGSGPLLLAFIR